MEVTIPVLNELSLELRTIGMGDANKATPMVEKCRSMLQSIPALRANLMDHRYGGSALTDAKRATALKSVKESCEDVGMDVAPLDEVLTFVV